MIGLGITEAESLDLVTYTVENRSDASGGQTIRILDAAGTQGTASGAFTGPTGTYDMTVTYFNENDGEATYEVLVNDVVVTSWIGTGGQGGRGTAATQALTLDLATDDVITLRGTVGGAELARFDAIEIIPNDPNINIPPVVDTPVADQTATEDNAFSFTLPAGTFFDGDGDPLTLTATLPDGSPPPTWLSFDDVTGTFSGTPLTGDIGTVTVRVTADDGEASVFDDFDIVVEEFSIPPANGTIGLGTTEAESLDLVAYEVESRSDASGGQMIRILDASGTQGTASGTFSGPTGTYDLTVTYFNESDGEATFEVLVNGLVAGSWIGTGGQGGRGTAATQALTLDLATDDVITLRGTVGGGELARFDAIEIVPNDPSINIPPVVDTPVTDQTAAPDAAFDFSLPSDTFFDGDGDLLMLSATLPDGSPLPSWLNFDDLTGTFSGTPTSGDLGTVTVRVTADDGEASVFDDFDIVVQVPPPTTGSIGLGTTEAESLDLTTYEIESRGNASGGQAIRIFDVPGTQGTATGAFTGPTGTYDVTVGYFNENDGEATFEVLVNGAQVATWTGAGGTSGAAPASEAFQVALATGDVIALRGTVGGGELARFDLIDIADAGGGPPTNGTFDLGTTEAESLDLVTYTVASRGDASGGQIIEIFDIDGTQGTASGAFAGPSGNYELAVSYLDESDGVGSYEVLINDQVAFSWLGDGGGSPSGTPDVETATVTLATDDVITIRGTVGTGEAVRVDKIDITPVVAGTIGLGTTEAESLTLSGYSVENRTTASGGQLIRVLGEAGDQGTASGTFTGPIGQYDVDITFFNENDGVGVYEVLVNGQVEFSWLGVGGNGGSGSPEVQSTTLDLDTGDVITLRGTVEGDAELVRIDKLDITDTGAGPGLPTIGLGTTEAETLSLSTYEVENRADASGSQAIRVFDVAGTAGTAEGTFTGAAATYNVSVTYFDESDGVGTYEFLVNGEVAFSWLGDGGTSSNGTPEVETATVALQPGDVITLRGTVGGNAELVRIDKLDILPTAVDPNTLNLVASDKAQIVDLSADYFSDAARILLLGDSLTEGADIPGGYRAPLFDILSHDLGLWVDFVGSRTTRPADGQLDIDHEGTGGIRASTVESNIATIAANNPADFALVMLGTNDVLQTSNPDATVPGDLLSIIQELHFANTSIEILLGELPPTDRDGGATEIPAVNALLPGVIADATNVGIDASLVDFSNITLADYYDGLHPDEDGVVKFAQNWLAGLQAVASVSAGTFDGTEIAISTDIVNAIGGSNNDRLTGDDGANMLDGHGGNDWIEGAGGNDILTGGTGTDVFVFAEGAGEDTITDFTTGADLIDLRSHAGATNFAALDITQVGGDAEIRVTGVTDTDVITLFNVNGAALADDDFIF